MKAGSCQPKSSIRGDAKAVLKPADAGDTFLAPKPGSRHCSEACEAIQSFEWSFRCLTILKRFVGEDHAFVEILVRSPNVRRRNIRRRHAR